MPGKRERSIGTEKGTVGTPFVLAERAASRRPSFDARNEGHPDNPLLVMVE